MKLKHFHTYKLYGLYPTYHNISILHIVQNIQSLCMQRGNIKITSDYYIINMLILIINISNGIKYIPTCSLIALVLLSTISTIFFDEKAAGFQENRKSGRYSALSENLERLYTKGFIVTYNHNKLLIRLLMIWYIWIKSSLFPVIHYHLAEHRLPARVAHRSEKTRNWRILGVPR